MGFQARQNSVLLVFSALFSGMSNKYIRDRTKNLEHGGNEPNMEKTKKRKVEIERNT